MALRRGPPQYGKADRPHYIMDSRDANRLGADFLTKRDSKKFNDILIAPSRRPSQRPPVGQRHWKKSIQKLWMRTICAREKIHTKTIFCWRKVSTFVSHFWWFFSWTFCCRKDHIKIKHANYFVMFYPPKKMKHWNKQAIQQKSNKNPTSCR